MGRPNAKTLAQFARVYLRTMDPEQAAQAIGAKNGVGLLARPEFAQQVDKQRQAMAGQLRQEDVTRALAELAFGRCNDCVKLALDPAAEVDRLDLRLLSEIRRNDKGTVEIRLVDRLAALARLEQLVGGGKGEAEGFLAAMSAAACEDGCGQA